MKKQWLFGTFAGIALLAAACNPNNMNTQQFGDNANRFGYDNQNQSAPFLRYTRDTTPFTAGNNGVRGNLFGDTTDQNGYSYYVHPNNRTGIRTTAANQFGYVRMNSAALRNRGNMANQPYLDRNALAKVVANVTCSIPGVNTSSVLVSDEEVFVGLTTRGGDDRPVRSKAYMAAMSVSPRWYRVYLTTDRKLMNQMDRIGRNRMNQANSDQAIEQLVRMFGGVPDGNQKTRSMRESGMNPYMTDAGYGGFDTFGIYGGPGKVDSYNLGTYDLYQKQNGVNVYGPNRLGRTVTSSINNLGTNVNQFINNMVPDNNRDMTPTTRPR